MLMYWATKKKPTREEERAKQINQLKHSFPSVRRPNNDDELFEVRFVADGQYSSLRVFITSEFPDTAPVIQAQGPVQHPWLDSQRVVVGSSKLRNWNSKTTLSEVVEECVQALMAGTNTAITKPPATVDSYGRPLSTSLPVAQSLPTANTAVNVTNTPAPGPAPVQAQAQLYRNPYAPVTAAPAALPMATATATAAAQPAPHSYPVIANVVPNPPRTSLPYTPAPAPTAAPAPLPYGYNYGGATAGASPYSQYSYPALAAVPAAAPAVTSAAVPPAVPPRTPAAAPAVAAAVAAPASAYSSPYNAQASPAVSSYPAIPAATASPVTAVSAYSAVPAPAASAYSAVPAVSSAYSAVPTPAASSYSAVPASYSAVPTPASSTYSAVPAVSSAYSTASAYSAVPAATAASPIAAVPAVNASNKSQPSSSQKQTQPQSVQEDSDEDEGLGAFVMPDIPVHCAELDSMTDVQLQRLINDDVALKALANKQESILSTMSLKDDLRSANLEKATRNVAMAEDIMAMQRKAQDLQAQLRAAHQEYQSEVSAANQEFGINAEEALKQLDKFKESLDSKSEDIGSKFVHGEMDVNAFLKEYLEVRTKYHDVNDRILLVSKPM